jgi:hypothetical protein
MKKSTLIFIIGNIVVLTIPIWLIVGLSFKISNGSLIDREAIRNAEIKSDSLKDIENIQINSRHKAITIYISRKEDNYSRMEMDTVDAKYIGYRKIGNTLVIDYDLHKDSLDNATDENTNSNGFAGINRTIGLSLNTDLKKIKLREAIMIYNLSSDFAIGRDLDIIADNSEFEMRKSSGEYYSKNRNYYDEGSRYNDPISYGITAKLSNSIFDINLAFVKKLKIESRNSILKIYDLDFDSFDLKIDNESPLSVDVSRFKKMKIGYLQ